MMAGNNRNRDDQLSTDDEAEYGYEEHLTPPSGYESRDVDEVPHTFPKEPRTLVRQGTEEVQGDIDEQDEEDEESLSIGGNSLASFKSTDFDHSP
eukprot:UN29459